jgi:hypothetical protein
MYAYSQKDGWTEIEDFLLAMHADDCEKQRELAGYSIYPALDVGDSEKNTFAVEVFGRDFSSVGREQTPYQYLVAIDIGTALEYVAIPKLPDLLDLLKQVIPLSVSIDEWAMKRSKFNEDFDRRLARGDFAGRGAKLDS